MTGTAPARATSDTELLGDPACRRFVSALWELAGGRLSVVPTVADELPGNARGSERRHWRRVLAWERDHANIHYDDETHRGIVDAVKQAAGEWMARELSGEGSGALVEARSFSPKEEEVAAEVASRLPKSCFRRPYLPNQQRDAAIIGESVALGFSLLSTQNMNTIKAEPTNDWLVKHGYARGPLIRDIAEAAQALNAGAGREEVALRAALGASLPAEDLGIDRDLKAVKRFVNRLLASHARKCAVWAEDALESLGDPDGLIREAREALPARTRAMEDARLRAVRLAAADAGFEGRFR